VGVVAVDPTADLPGAPFWETRIRTLMRARHQTRAYSSAAWVARGRIGDACRRLVMAVLLFDAMGMDGMSYWWNW